MIKIEAEKMNDPEIKVELEEYYQYLTVGYIGQDNQYVLVANVIGQPLPSNISKDDIHGYVVNNFADFEIIKELYHSGVLFLDAFCYNGWQNFGILYLQKKLLKRLTIKSQAKNTDF